VSHAYRKDLADIALAGRVIASHYAEPMPKLIAVASPLRAAPDGEEIATLQPGDSFDLLDDSLGWAWGYGGSDRRVGYVRSDALS
jgi:hypothetical protein